MRCCRRHPTGGSQIVFRNFLITGAVMVLVGGCTWVKPTAAGAGVVVAESFNVRDCRQVSTITTSVKHTIGAKERKAEKVELELTTLARNEAAVRGGDTIVPLGEVEAGARSYAVYACSGS
ncbi:MAG: DUF4156 domain-containing protein [Xanthomonadales bacterium]|nr:DUF4156 domain-containing protein [Xanthomonadales bacterium]